MLPNVPVAKRKSNNDLMTSEQNISDAEVFCIRPGFVFWKENGKYGFLDKALFKQGSLNSSAYLILRCLDGYTNIRDIVKTLQTHLRIPKDKLAIVRKETCDFIEKGIKAGFILSGSLHRYCSSYWKDDAIFDGYGYRYPKLLYWEVTAACNQACKFCYNCCEDSSGQNELTTIQGKRLIEYFAEVGIKNIIFTGGEPLTRLDRVLNWIRKCKSLGISTELFTNGKLLSSRIARQLKEIGLDYCRVSIHSTDENVHDEITGSKGNWRQSLRGLQNLIEYEIPSAWMMTVARYNIDSLRASVEKAISLGCHGFLTGPLCKIGRGNLLSNYTLSPCQYLQLLRFNVETGIVYGDKIKIGWGADINMESPWKDYITEPLSPPKSDSKRFFDWYMRFAKNSICGTGVRSLALDAKGQYIPCPALGTLKLGSALNEDIEKIWHKDALSIFRKKPIDNFDDCGNCGLRFSCAGGCRANAHAQTGSITGCDLSYKEAYDWLEENDYETVTSYYDRHELEQKKPHLREGEHLVGSASEGYGPWTPPVSSALKAIRNRES